MTRNECLEAILEELSSVGISPKLNYGGKHIRVSWKNGAGDSRLVTASISPSDWRSVANHRTDVRKILRQDGYLDDMADAVAVIKPSIGVRAGHAICDSLTLAEHFGRAHKNVLREIDRLIEECGDEFSRLNFEPSNYVSENGKQYRCFNLTRDGFSMLAMGFTGAMATQWKIKYIDAFNAMEAELKSAAAQVALPAETIARIERLEGDLNALTDIVLSAGLPQPEPGFVVVKAHKRRVRGIHNGSMVSSL